VTIDPFFFPTLAGAVGGGALGARLTRAPVWKGAAVTVAASLGEVTIAEAIGVVQFVLEVLIYVVLIGLVGGRWGLGMSARQLSIIVLGNFLFAMLAGAALFLLMPTAEAG
jgi:hypothetical protein